MITARPAAPALGLQAYHTAFRGILYRELLRFIHQRSRFFSALVRPLVWLAVFAAGFRAALGISIIEPYGTYITYEVYIAPGLVAMVLLFNAMQSSLSMVYDREMGGMRVLLMSPLPRGYLLLCKLLASALVSVPQVYAFLAVAWWFGVEPPLVGYFWLLPALLLCALLLGALGLFISTFIRQLENFAGVMNFVIFPMFFISSALYPLWKMQEAGELLYRLCQLNPFTYCVELIRFALYGKLNAQALLVVSVTALLLVLMAVLAFNPQRGMTRAGKA
ncbi:ABC transporter permease [Motiliproteus sp. SC1-56]|uniref:ABC transporter permease n=1 Tax=Motiliproteus sp. SC1-56 TaxID=2799565 RepID=UPI001A90A048|nr:ABC transporter permease [Motiliproteus sp. SC1-56]